jgi:hypothetical protein
MLRSVRSTHFRADWQIRGEPIFHAGNFYFPAGPTIHFDGNVMVRTGTYNGVPLYADTTIEPFSIVYVPIGRNVMRPYERRRAGEIAGTVGSRAPSFPVQRDGDVSLASGRIGIQTPAQQGAIEAIVIPEARRPVATSGAATPRTAPTTAPAISTRTGVESIPRPTSNAGIWIEYGGSRWYSSGPAVIYSVDRFQPAGDYRGFPVYRDDGSSDTIYVTVVRDGPLAPFTRRQAGR